jgi:hypothetical protein
MWIVLCISCDYLSNANQFTPKGTCADIAAKDPAQLTCEFMLSLTTQCTCSTPWSFIYVNFSLASQLL